MTVVEISYEQTVALKALGSLLEDLIESLLHDSLPGGRMLKDATCRQLKRVAVMYRTAQLLFQSLSDGNRMQKRDLFYRDCRLFKRQTTSDGSIARLTKLIGVPREALNLVGASKGLLYGGWLRMCTITGGCLDITANGTRHLVPYVQDIRSVDGNFEFVLIVEKEAIFELICAAWESIYEGIGRVPFLVLTAKGYPDRASQLFLGTLRMQKPCCRFFALVDWDPFGMDIYLQYCRGLRDCYCAIPDLMLLGITHNDVLDHHHQQCNSLNQHDKKKLYSLLRRIDNEAIRRELLFMNDRNEKMEIDVLANDSCLAFTNEYLINRLAKTLMLSH